MVLENESLKSLMCLVATLKFLLITKKYEYDLIVAIGDSGLFMSTIVTFVFSILNLNCPPIIQIPIYRYKMKKMYHSIDKSDWFDNSILEKEVSDFINKIPNVSRILIPDDEIGLGVSVRSAIKLIFENKKRLHSTTGIPKIDIIAEDHGFEFNDLLTRYDIHLYSIHQQIQSVYHIITNHIPNNIVAIFRQSFSLRKYSDKVLLNLLLNNPTKKIRSGIPYFSYEPNKKVLTKISNFNNLSLEYRNFLSSKISQFSKINTISDKEMQHLGNDNRFEIWKLPSLN